MNTSNEFPLPKNSYAAFDAISLRNLIIKRMDDQKLFTDQNYIGSNLASIIDIISYSYNTLIYYLNKTSTESTFTEAQLYENISRIVKLLDYKPIGYQTSTLTFNASANSNFPAGVFTIPRYSYLTIGGVSFSFNEDITFKIPTANVITPLTELTNTKLLYQGVYRENPVHTAVGDINEVVPITITNASNALVDHFNIDVYVWEKDTEMWYQYSNVPNLYTEQAYSRSFEKRLSESQSYEITFGDGINGRQLAIGDKVAIYALQSSGSSGVVGPNSLQKNQPVVYSTNTFSKIWADVTSAEQYDVITSTQLKNISFTNDVGSTIPAEAESVDSIRNNAPTNFKSQYRLVTQSDYETFVKMNFANFITDAKVFTNWDYTGSYLKYFQDIEVSPTEYRQILLNHTLYADSCNFNNLYICIIPKASQSSSLKYLLPAQKEVILSNINSLKTMSTEVIFVDPIYKHVSFCTPMEDGKLDVYDVAFTKLQVVKSSASRRSDSSILKEVEAKIKSFFEPTNAMIGESFDYNTLVTNLLSIEGVGKLRTKRTDTGDAYEGVSFYMWNPNYPSLDIERVVSSLQMKQFEVIAFDQLSQLHSKLEIVYS
jgi:hypothetical protein